MSITGELRQQCGFDCTSRIQGCWCNVMLCARNPVGRLLCGTEEAAGSVLEPDVFVILGGTVMFSVVERQLGWSSALLVFMGNALVVLV